MKPTYEELETKCGELEVELKQVKELLKQALDRITKLEEQLNTNSKNSSKPPSTDKKANTNEGDKEPKKGHEGKARSLYLPERVNRHVQCTLENCPHCGSNAVKLMGQPEILQQAELPEAKATVTEYQLHKYHCMGCGKNCAANLPLGIPDSAFGPKLMGLVATLTGVFHLAKREVIDLMQELYDVNIGVGSIPNIEERVSLALDPIYQRIHSFVIEGKFCKHFDETGWRDSGKTHFAWIATSEKAAFYRIDRNRSSEAFERLVGKVSRNFAAVTDRYAVYNKIETHQYCLAHLIRDFRKYAERDGPDKEIGKALEEELIKVCHIHGEYRKEKITFEQRNQRIGYCKHKIEILLLDDMANGSDQLFKLSDGVAP